MALSFSAGIPARCRALRFDESALLVDVALHFDPPVPFDRLDRIDDQIQQRLGELAGIGHHRRQVVGHCVTISMLPRRRFGLAATRRRGRSPCRLRPAARSSADGPASRRKCFTMLSSRCNSPWMISSRPASFLLHLRGALRQVFLQQLHVDVQRTERIANLVGQPRQQPRQQQLLLRRRQLRHVLAERLCQYAFHTEDDHPTRPYLCNSAKPWPGPLPFRKGEGAT